MSAAARSLLALALVGCGGEFSEQRGSETGVVAAHAPFDERAEALGLVFSYWNGMSPAHAGEHYFPEVFGGGAALLDYDGDGDLDVFLVQGSRLDTATGEASVSGGALGDRLFRNDLDPPEAGNEHPPRVPRFVDVTEESGLGFVGYGMGAATGDVDNDGDIDLYVTRLGRNHLWRNEGDGTFRDVTATAGVDDPRWSVPAVFFDLDRDGWLDLYVGNYVGWSLGVHKVCATIAGEPDYCSPRSFTPETDRLFRNRGDATFEDISVSSGIGTLAANTLGAVAADFDGDRHLDLYVANDWMANFLWRNRGDGTFEETGLISGVAFDAAGTAQASMGVDAADPDRDGDWDLFMTHLRGETNTFYRNESPGRFLDRSAASGVAVPSLPFTGFGTVFFDLEHDGDLDLVVANGAIRRIEEQAIAGVAYPLAERNQLFRNDGGGFFEDISDLGGAAFAELTVSRAIAAGDLDNDGDLDLVVVNSNGPVRVLMNRAADSRPWLGLRLLDTAGRDALGARVGLMLGAGRPALWRRVRTDGSYLAAHDPRVTFGVGADLEIDAVVVDWPDGRTERFPPPTLHVYTSLRQGTGAQP